MGIKIAIYATMALAAGLFFYVAYTFLAEAYGKRETVFDGINRRYQASGKMSKAKLELSKLGVMYRLGNYGLTPAYYEVLRLGVGVVAGLLGALVTKSFLAFAVLLVAGYVGVPLYFRYENGKDNEEIVMDVYNTYANIKMQMGAGIYVRECLEYTYGVVKNERYREALAELILNFSDKTVATHDAVEMFKNKFSSLEIDKLAALLGSFMQYGMNTSHTEDIMSEIQGLIQADTLKAEHDIEMKAEVTNFAFFGIIIAMVVFIVFQSFSLGGVF